MKLSEIKSVLVEAKHRQDTSIEEALELIKTNCKDMNLAQPLWRGTKNGTEAAYVLHGEAGGRSSANTSNHYTVILDYFLPVHGYPARGKSVILASHDNLDYAKTYGTVYAIYPYDEVPIGVVPVEDIWHLRFRIGDELKGRSMASWNDLLDRAGIPDYSYEDLVQGIKDALENPDDAYYDTMVSIFGHPDDVEPILEEAYSPENLGLKLVTSKTRIQGDKELWVGGKCVAIRYDVWEKLMDEAR